MKNRLRELRERKGLSLAELARLADTTAGTVQRLETGSRRMTLDWLDRMARALNVSATEIMADDARIEIAGTFDEEWNVDFRPPTAAPLGAVDMAFFGSTRDLAALIPVDDKVHSPGPLIFRRGSAQKPKRLGLWLISYRETDGALRHAVRYVEPRGGDAFAIYLSNPAAARVVEVEAAYPVEWIKCS